MTGDLTVSLIFGALGLLFWVAYRNPETNPLTLGMYRYFAATNRLARPEMVFVVGAGAFWLVALMFLAFAALGM